MVAEEVVEGAAMEKGKARAQDSDDEDEFWDDGSEMVAEGMAEVAAIEKDQVSDDQLEDDEVNDDFFVETDEVGDEVDFEYEMAEKVVGVANMEDVATDNQLEDDEVFDEFADETEVGDEVDSGYELESETDGE